MNCIFVQMGKRKIRILNSQLHNELAGFVGQEVHLVHKNHTTIFGKLISANGEIAVVQDVNAAWYNRKKHTHSIPFKEIREVIITQVTLY